MESHISNAFPKVFQAGVFNTGENQYENKDSTSQNSSLIESTLYSSLKNLNRNTAAPSENRVDEFKPEKVAENVLSFVANAIASRGGSTLEKQSLLAQAREGVQQGINDAQNILSSSGNLSDELTQDINQTQQLIFKGLDKLASEFSGNTPVNSSPVPIERAQSHFISASKQSSQQTSIQIETREGDIVSINLSRFSSTAFSQADVSNVSSALSASQKSTKNSLDFSFNVQGNLNAGEQKAIENLVRDIAKVAKNFFNGDIQNAFNKALDLNINGQELAAFSLDLNYSRQSEVVSTYQNIENINAASTENIASIADAVNYAVDLSQLLNNNRLESVFNNPARASADIYQQLIEQQNHDDKVGNKSLALLQQLLGNLQGLA